MTPHLTITASGLQYQIKTLPGLGPGEEGRTLELMSEKKYFKRQTYQESKGEQLFLIEIFSLKSPLGSRFFDFSFSSFSPWQRSTSSTLERSSLFSLPLPLESLQSSSTPSIQDSASLDSRKRPPDLSFC